MPAASHPIPPPDRNHAPERVASTTLRTLRVSVYSSGTVDVALYVCMYGHTYSKSMDQPGEVASPARSSQPKRKNEYFPVRVRT